MKVSIVITAYNVGNYIEKTIKSCIEQTYKDIEIIIVNDCSTDNTLSIIVKYFKEDNRIKLVKNKHNVGAGLSRRYGIQYSTGDYIMLLDGDDWLNPNCIEDLCNEAEQSNADMISGGINVVYNNEKYRTISYGRYILEGTDKINKTFGNDIVFLNNMIVRRSLYDIVKYSSRRYVEDTQTLVMLLHYANKVSYIPSIGYNYYQRDDSLSHTSNLAKDNLFKGLCYKDIMEFFKSIKCTDYDAKFNKTQILFYLKELKRAMNDGHSVNKFYKEYIEFTQYIFNNYLNL